MTKSEARSSLVSSLMPSSLSQITVRRLSANKYTESETHSFSSGIRSLPNAVGRNFTDFNNLAILHYAGAPDANPTEDPTVNIPVSILPLVETNLHVRRFYSLPI